jgi:hypothetical protein
LLSFLLPVTKNWLCSKKIGQGNWAKRNPKKETIKKIANRMATAFTKKPPFESRKKADWMCKETAFKPKQSAYLKTAGK